MSRTPSIREYCHERLKARLHQCVSDYDTSQRIETLIEEFLSREDLKGKSALDVGCGLGFFAEKLCDLDLVVIGCDIGEGLVEATRNRARCNAVIADALYLEEAFGPDRFDIVVSSECIEHTPEPERAIRQMLKVLRVGGLLSLSTPNRIWQPVVRMATWLGLRPFDGLENFSTFSSIRRVLSENGAVILREKGLHLFPFQLPLHGISRWCDHRLQCARSLMINLCILARKVK